MSKKWYETSFRRNLVDMHIDDWNAEFLSKFDSRQYYDCLKAGRIQSPMIYLQSHVGLCNWPARSGRMHAGFGGVNKLRELIDLCHAGGMDVVGYYSLIYNNWAYEAHPEWRMRDRDGNPSRNDAAHGFMSGGRYGLVCPNHPGYRQFVNTQFAELLGAYPLEGMFLDMTFWPMPCYCDECEKRFRAENGHDIPTEINWDNPVWRQFQAARERWLNGFALACTAELKRLQPTVTVEHQFSTIHQHWVFGVNEGVGEASDYAGGDLYGGHIQESFICKLYYEITRNQPFEYMTSRCDPNLLDHTTTKSPDALRTHNFLTLAHHGAMLFIDAIDPVGTINPKVYETIGRVFEESMPYERYMTGRLVADTAVYFNLESRMDPHAGGETIDYSNPQLDSAVGAAVALTDHNYLYTVIPSNRRERIFGKKVVIVTNAAFLSDGEIDNFSRYVEQGGSLYIGGNTDPRLAERLLGIERVGFTAEAITYIAPTEAGQSLFGEHYTRDYPIAYPHAQIIARNPRGHTALATVTLPYTNPDDKNTFAAIHSNPPGVKTDMPALVTGVYGNGRVVWSASSFERNAQRAHKDVFARVIDFLYGGEPMLQSTAPDFVQFTLFDDADRYCLYLSAINVQEQTPVINIGDFAVSLGTEKPVRAVTLLPEETPVEFGYQDGVLEFEVKDIDIIRMYRIDL